MIFRSRTATCSSGTCPTRTRIARAKRGVLVSKLDIAINSSGEEVAANPSTPRRHVCRGSPLRSGRERLPAVHRRGWTAAWHPLQVLHSFSSKPVRGHYLDYYEKVSTYVAELSAAAQKIEPSLTAQTYPVVETRSKDSVFQYMDRRPAALGFRASRRKLENLKITIAGLGGTGAYVLDQVAKTPVRENSPIRRRRVLAPQRLPGARRSLPRRLKTKPRKVTYLHGIYSRMHRHIVPHAYPVDQNTVGELAGMHFVFLCVDKGRDQRTHRGYLEQQRIPFIDVGMGVYCEERRALRRVEVATGTPTSYVALRQHARVPFSDGADDEYTSNIQIADLNALNAMLAVVKWKKLFRILWATSSVSTSAPSRSTATRLRTKTGMTPETVFGYEFVKLLPPELKAGVVYVSIEYGTAAHLCACGASSKVVTADYTDGLEAVFDGETISCTPPSAG